LAAEPRWVPIEAVIAINRDIVGQTAEPHDVRNRQALQTAIAHPWNVWVYFMDRDIPMLTARLFTSLAGAQAFAAGNKRTAYRAAITFIESNGYTFDPPQQHAIDRLLGYFDGKLGQTGVVEWFRWGMTPV
jgi:death-on-curing protein